VRPIIVERRDWKWVPPQLMCPVCRHHAGGSRVTAEIVLAVETALHGIAHVFTTTNTAAEGDGE
jgi:hypothetical protein